MITDAASKAHAALLLSLSDNELAFDEAFAAYRDLCAALGKEVSPLVLDAKAKRYAKTFPKRPS